MVCWSELKVMHGYRASLMSGQGRHMSQISWYILVPLWTMTSLPMSPISIWSYSIQPPCPGTRWEHSYKHVYACLCHIKKTSFLNITIHSLPWCVPLFPWKKATASNGGDLGRGQRNWDPQRAARHRPVGGSPPLQAVAGASPGLATNVGSQAWD